MASIQDQVASLGDLAARVPAFVYEQDRLLLMGIAAVAAGAGVGTVARNHELGPVAKVLVALLIFATVIGLGLLAAYAIPILADMGRQARGGSQ